MRKTLKVWFVLSLLFLPIMLYFFDFYIHEAGHITMGIFINLLRGKLVIPLINSWIGGFLPQQTGNLPNHPYVYFGGPIFGISFFLWFSYKCATTIKCKRPRIFYLVSIFFVVYEFFRNIIFGTDNWRNNTLISAQTLPFFNYFIVYGIFILFILNLFILIWSGLLRRVKYSL